MLPVMVITVLIAPLFGDNASVAGVTEIPAEAIEPGTPTGVMSIQYPPPTVSGTVTVVDIAPVASEVTDNTPKPPEQPPDDVLKQML